jgi:hypothetical protein
MSDQTRCAIGGHDMTGRPFGVRTEPHGQPICGECLDALPDEARAEPVAKIRIRPVFDGNLNGPILVLGPRERAGRVGTEAQLCAVRRYIRQVRKRDEYMYGVGELPEPPPDLHALFDAFGRPDRIEIQAYEPVGIPA